MLIDTVLNAKGRDVFTISPDAGVANAAQAMHRQRVGVLVVTGKAGEILGVISERDVIGALGANGAKAMRLTVSDLMTRSVITCRSSDTAEDVMRLMVRNRIRHVPVVDDGLVGVVSARDLLAENLHQQTVTVQSLLSLNRCRPRTPSYAFGG